MPKAEGRPSDRLQPVTVPQAPAAIPTAQPAKPQPATPATVQVASPARRGEGTVSVRQIDNGYIVRESRWDDDTGRHTEREVYTPEPPHIEVKD